MLQSHNDSAVAIAECIGGSVDNFSAMMNAKAKEIGCKNTHFCHLRMDWMQKILVEHITQLQKIWL